MSIINSRLTSSKLAVKSAFNSTSIQSSPGGPKGNVNLVAIFSALPYLRKVLAFGHIFALEEMLLLFYEYHFGAILQAKCSKVSSCVFFLSFIFKDLKPKISILTKFSLYFTGLMDQETFLLHHPYLNVSSFLLLLFWVSNQIWLQYFKDFLFVWQSGTVHTRLVNEKKVSLVLANETLPSIFQVVMQKY